MMAWPHQENASRELDFRGSIIIVCMHAMLADSPCSSATDVWDCVGDSWVNNIKNARCNPHAVDGLQTHRFYVLCILLHIVFFLICVQVSIRCSLIIRWCLFSGMYCVVVVLGVWRCIWKWWLWAGGWVWGGVLGRWVGEKLGTVVTVRREGMLQIS